MRAAFWAITAPQELLRPIVCAPSQRARGFLGVLLALVFLPLATIGAQARATGTLSGIVVDSASAPVQVAIVEVRSPSLANPSIHSTDETGRFVFDALAPGVYDLTVRRVGFQSATLNALRVAAGRITEVRVVLAQSPTQLSTISVLASAIAVDVTTPAQVERLERQSIRMLATGRDVTSLVGLVPGSRAGVVWGGGGELSNNVQLDGVSTGHPGVGGDFLRPSVDWIERVEVRGLGAGADQGNFQGGVINAITRTGTDRREVALRAYVEAASLSESNFNLREDGFEQAGRRELSGEAAGPIVPGQLHYFVGAQAVARDLRVPDLTVSNEGVGFRDVQTNQREVRGLAKLTWRPDVTRRVDLIVGGTSASTERMGLTGLDDPDAAQRVSAPSAFYELAWAYHPNARHAFDVRLVGYSATERRSPYHGNNVPAVRGLSFGREPYYQNAEFRERLDPSNIALKGTWSTQFTALGRRHGLISGVEASRGSWERETLRNGGVTWRAYPNPADGSLDPRDPSTWAATGSQWDGEMRLNSGVRSAAVFIQAELALGPRLTLSPGMRASYWKGELHSLSGATPGLSATGWDPRVGLAWDVFGDGRTALKAHWGRYHQGMAAALFDRLAGADVYSNELFWPDNPTPSDPRFAPTPQQREASFLDPNGQPLAPIVKRFDESGRADGYGQPYMDQVVLAAERALGTRWKVEAVYTNRRNRDMVGLLDRNLATNHTPIHDLAIRTRFGGLIAAPSGEPLLLGTVWIPNDQLRAVLIRTQGEFRPPPVGFSYDTIASLTWDPDYVVTRLPDARRVFQQAYVALRTEQDRWAAAGSFAWTKLEGNVAGVTAFGGVGEAFRAGGWARPNEATNSSGLLDNFAELEAKFWLSAQLRWGLQGGVTLTHVTGERITPFFELESFRYRYATAHFGGTAYPSDLLEGAEGQTIYLESRGNRRLADRTILDLRLERGFRVRNQNVFATIDLFNALGENAATAVRLRVDDGQSGDPISRYGAPSQRVSPRRLRIGTRIEF